MILVCISLVACASTPNVVEKPDTEEYAPIQQLSQSSKPYSKGGLLSEKAGLNLFDDRRAYRAGDIITVILNERTISSKSTETKIDKDSKVVIIFCDHGSRYMSKIYNDKWMSDQGFFDSQKTHQEKPIEYIK